MLSSRSNADHPPQEGIQAQPGSGSAKRWPVAFALAFLIGIGVGPVSEVLHLSRSASTFITGFLLGAVVVCSIPFGSRVSRYLALLLVPPIFGLFVLGTRWFSQRLF
jgi:hypothetical protein